MSSSRSIAAARNRRAMEQQQPNLLQRSRPNTSIASQPAFSQTQQPSQQFKQQQYQQYQQQQQQKQQQQRLLNDNPNNSNSKPSRNFQSGSTPGSVPVAVNKISVSDAIGLITIRLGRVEQYMQSLDEQGFLNNSLPGEENKTFQNKEIIDNLMERIYSLENKPTSVASIDNNLVVDKLKNTISELEGEIYSLKEILKNQMNKLDSLSIETENRFLDIENAFVEIEKKDTLEEVNEVDQEGNIQLIMSETYNKDEEMDASIQTVDLKSIINKELASEDL